MPADGRERTLRTCRRPYHLTSVVDEFNRNLFSKTVTLDLVTDESDESVRPNTLKWPLSALSLFAFSEDLAPILVSKYVVTHNLCWRWG